MSTYPRNSRAFFVASLLSMVAAGVQQAEAQEDEDADGKPSKEANTGSAGIDEIVVTATRREESLMDVPISVTAFTKEQMDRQGVRSFDDLVKLTPGLSLEPGQLRQPISIRGVASNAGSATTGVYIDETPIQVRQLGVSAQNVYPTIFDLERVEVLRGPQGTLFGAGSQGGTVRFIQAAPNMEESSGYTRAEYSFNQAGGTGYEMGIAGGRPLIENVLGFRASLFHRRDAGWIDEQTGSLEIVDETGASGPAAVQWRPTGTVTENANWMETTAARFALTWRPMDTIDITPSVFWQERYSPNRTFSYLEAASDSDESRYVSPQWVPTIDDYHYQVPSLPLDEPFKEHFTLPSLLITWDVGSATLVSNTSFFDRKSTLYSDYTFSHTSTYARRKVPLEGDWGQSYHLNEQENFTQEVRIDTPLFNDRANWVVGVFYSEDKQHNLQISYNNFIAAADSIAVGAVEGFPAPDPAVTDGPPYGEGYSAFVNYYGIDLVDGYIQYIADLRNKEEQLAGFTQFDFDVTDKLAFTAGVRWSRNENTLTPSYDGPITNLNIPQGRACVPPTGAPGGPECIPVEVGEYAPGEGPFAPEFVTDPESGSETAVTPKFGASYTTDAGTMYYTTVAKGFRAGGAQQRQPSNCDAQLISLGYVAEDGTANPPTTFDSDNLWSYEVGTKGRFLDNRLQLDASVYVIKWDDIQSTVSLSSCLQSINDNLGGATGQGFDLAMQFAATDALILSASVGYNETTFDQDTVLGGRTVYTKDSAIPYSGSPWTAILSGDYTIFGVDARDWYVHVDFTYKSEEERTGNTDPDVYNYDPLLAPRPETYQLNARFGMRSMRGLDVSLFINNVTNEHPDLLLSRSSTSQVVWTNYTFVPRTVGVTVAYRY